MNTAGDQPVARSTLGPTTGSSTEGGGPVVPHERELGDVVDGRYEIRGLLGRGGMGRVDLVHHLGWEELVAVKRPLSGLADDTATARVIDEARLWIGLPPHPHLCTCHYVDVVDGEPWIVIEYVSGGSVADRLAAGDLAELPAVLDVAVQTAWGLAAAHAAGVAHRDVKPGNLLLSADGVVRVTDFGLASAIPGNHDATAPDDTTVGGLTPAYAAPEQARDGRSGRAGDVYSWAMTVLSLFTGGPVWRTGADRDVLLGLLTGERRVGTPVPADLAEVLTDCLRSDPRRRPRMDRVAEQVRAVYRTETGADHVRGVPGSAAHLADGLNNRALSWQELGETARAERVWDEALAIDPRHPESTFNRAMLRWRTGRSTSTTVLNDMADLYENPDDENRDLIDELVGEMLRERGTAETTQEFLGGHGGVHTVSPARGGETVFAGTGNGTVLWWDPDTGRCLTSWTGHGGRVGVVTGVPRLGIVASGGLDHTVRIRRIPGAAGVLLRRRRSGGRVLTGHTHEVVAISGLLDGLLTVDAGGTVLLWSATNWRVHHRLTLPWEPAVVAFAPGALLCGTEDGRLGCREITGEVRWEVPDAHDGGVVSMAVDQPFVVTGGADRTVRLWDLADGRLHAELAGHGGVITALTARVGTVISGDDVGEVHLWDVEQRRSVLGALQDHPVSSLLLLDGGRVVVGDAAGALRVGAMRPGTPVPSRYSRPSSADRIVRDAARFRDELGAARSASERGDHRAAGGHLSAAREVPGHARHPDLREPTLSASGGAPFSAFVAARQVGLLPADHDGPVSAVVLAPDLRHALTAGDDGSVRWWDIGSRTCRFVLTGHAGPVTSAVLDRSGTRGFTASLDGTVRVWDLHTGRCDTVLTCPGGRLLSVAVSADGRSVVAAGSVPDSTAGRSGALRRWDLPDVRGVEIAVPRAVDDVHSVAVSADGRWLVAATSHRTLLRWRDDERVERTGRELRPDLAWITAMAATPDADRVLLGRGDRSLGLWDVRDDAPPPWPPARMLAPATAVRIGADAHAGLALGADGAAVLWDVLGRPLHTFPGRTTAIALTPDAQYVATARTDSTIAVWQLHWDYAPSDTT